MAANDWCEEEHYWCDWTDGFGDAESAYYEKRDHMKRKRRMSEAAPELPKDDAMPKRLVAYRPERQEAWDCRLRQRKSHPTWDRPFRWGAYIKYATSVAFPSNRDGYLHEVIMGHRFEHPSLSRWSLKESVQNRFTNSLIRIPMLSPTTNPSHCEGFL